MKLKTCLMTLAATGTAFFLLYLLGQVKALKIEARALQDSLALASTNHAATVTTPGSKVVRTQPQSPIDIADYMTKFQRHAIKLYFAAKLQNWPLADFYVEEIEETVNEVSRKELVDGPVNVSELAPALMNSTILELERAVARKDWPEFEPIYQKLVTSCNACHLATKHPYVVIETPRTPIFDNQRYEPMKTAAAQVSSNEASTDASKAHP